jgi:hypothetical protein
MKKRVLLFGFLFSVLTSFSQTSGDIDKDGILDATDNCKYMYNPKQEDLDKSGVGDACEFSPILLRKSISILEDVKIGYEELMSKFIQDSLKPYISFGDGTYKDFLETTSEKLRVLKGLKTATTEVFKLPFVYKKEGVTLTDTLNVYIIRYLAWTKNVGKIQNGYVPYYYESFSNGRTGIDNNKFGPHQFFEPANQSYFVPYDIDNNGINDLIGQSVLLYYPPISDTSKRNEMYNIQRFGIPVYIKFDSSFNVTYYHENFRNPDVLWHQPDFYALTDLNKDGKKEIINFGEHYHTDYFLGTQDPKDAKNILGKDVMKYLGMLENRDYNLNTAGKLSRYYSIEGGRLVDKKDNFDYTNYNYDPQLSPYTSNSKFVSIFGNTYGDIDNDGDIDFIQSTQVDGLNIETFINDGKGIFKANRYKTEQYSYNTTPEGENILVDINGDGYLDYFFGGMRIVNRMDMNANDHELGYVLNNKDGSFKIESPVFLGSFGQNKIAPKYMYVDDLDNDGNKEIIVYRSTGLGSGGVGIQSYPFVDDILIFSTGKNGLFENTSKFIDTLSRSNMYSQDSHLYFEDLDGDKIKDLFIQYQVDSGIVHSYPFNGYWEKNYNGFSYFKGSKEGKFKYTRLGRFNYQDGFKNWYSTSENSGIFANDFQLSDLDNDGTAELIHHPFIGINLLIFKLYDCPKPTISPSKTSICGTDSVSVKITNRDASFKYAWYINNDSVSKSSDSIFVKKEGYVKLKITDTLGCTKFSDSVLLKSFALPTTPTISRDTANNLVSSAAVRNTWFKDAAAISDTTQKIKPSGAGSFTVKTSENGCASLASSAYYYLVTDIIKLSADEFIKLAPNPFQGQLNFDFNIKAYQKLNIDVFELTTGTKRASQQNVLPGSILSFGFLAPGTYIIKVSSSDQKLSHQFKMIKL